MFFHIYFLAFTKFTPITRAPIATIINCRLLVLDLVFNYLFNVFIYFYFLNIFELINLSLSTYTFFISFLASIIILTYKKKY